MSSMQGMGPKAGDMAVVNARYPIMGNPIDAARISPDLTREFAGKKVGFCCPECPKKWDAMTAMERQKKLDAAMAEE